MTASPHSSPRRPMQATWLVAGIMAAGLAAGLIACEPAAPVIESTQILEPTPDTAGPYVVQSVIVGVGGHRVELRYRVDDDPSFIPLPMVADPGGELFAAAIPGRPAGSQIAYYVTVLDGTARVADDPEAAAAGPYVFTILGE